MTKFVSRTIRSSVGRNVLFLGASAAAKGFSSILFILLAVRALEPEHTGEVILAFLLIRIAQNVAGVGFSRYLARESAFDPATANGLSLDVLKFLGCLLPLGLAIAALVLLLDRELGLAAAMIVVAGLTGSVQQALGGTFLGRERTYLESATELAGAVVLVCGAVAVAALDRGPLAFVGVVAVSRVVGAGLALALFDRYFKPGWALASASVRRAFVQGLPYMLNAGSSFVFLRADILLLGVLSGTTAVSIYGGVADPLVTLGATVHIVNTAFLPNLSSSGAERPRIAGRMLLLDLALGGVIALTLALTAGPFAERFFEGGESASVDVARVLSFGLVLRFVNNGFATWLTGAGLQWRRTVIAIGAGVFNITVNLVAISIWGYWAAVWSTLATEVLILGLSVIALRPEIAPAKGSSEAAMVPVPKGYGLGPE
jgi:O-antigen/teichoic acid export membrane protein